MAGSAFKDEAVVAAAAHFTPILIDSDVEKGAAAKYAVRSFPTVVFATAKGKVVGTVVGAVSVKEFLAGVEAAKSKAKRGPGSALWRTLTKHDRKLRKAETAGDVQGILAAVAAMEQTGLEHALVKGARAARDRAVARGRAALARLQQSLEAGDRSKDLAASLRKLAESYRGTAVGDAAAKLVGKLSGK